MADLSQTDSSQADSSQADSSQADSSQADSSQADSSRSSRYEVYFSGRVQGVGFRYTAREIAARFAVTGYVRNLADGRVQLVAEGAGPEVERFVQAVRGEMDRFIASADLTSAAATGEFADFSVRF